jgi:hypothetical protein
MNKAVSPFSGCALASSPGVDQQLRLAVAVRDLDLRHLTSQRLVCIAESESSIADNSAYGTPPPAPPVLNQENLIQVGKAFQKYSDTREGQQTCQFAEDISPARTAVSPIRAPSRRR